MSVILAGRQGWTPKADPMQLWLGLPMMLVSVWQVGQDSLLVVLASTLQLWFTLNLLLFVRLLILDLMPWPRWGLLSCVKEDMGFSQNRDTAKDASIRQSMVLARDWGGLGEVLMLLARTVAISM